MIFKSTWIVWTLSTPPSPTNTTTLTFAPRKMSTARAPWKISAKSYSGIGCECPRTCWNSTRTSPAWMSARKSTIWRKPAIRRRFGSWNPASASIISIIGLWTICRWRGAMTLPPSTAARAGRSTAPRDSRWDVMSRWKAVQNILAPFSRRFDWQLITWSFDWLIDWLIDSLVVLCY